MCDPITVGVGMAAVGVAGGVQDAKNADDAWASAETARRKQNIESVHQSNLQDANLQLQDLSNFEEAREALTNHSLDTLKAQGAVRTAAYEGNLSGNSINRVVNDSDNVMLRSKGQINEKYERDYTNIYSERESNRDGLIATLNNSYAVKPPSLMSKITGVVTSGAKGFSSGASMGAAAKK